MLRINRSLINNIVFLFATSIVALIALIMMLNLSNNLQLSGKWDYPKNYRNKEVVNKIEFYTSNAPVRGGDLDLNNFEGHQIIVTKNVGLFDRVEFDLNIISGSYIDFIYNYSKDGFSAIRLVDKDSAQKIFFYDATKDGEFKSLEFISGGKLNNKSRVEVYFDAKQLKILINGKRFASKKIDNELNGQLGFRGGLYGGSIDNFSIYRGDELIFFDNFNGWFFDFNFLMSIFRSLTCVFGSIVALLGLCRIYKSWVEYRSVDKLKYYIAAIIILPIFPIYIYLYPPNIPIYSSLKNNDLNFESSQSGYDYLSDSFDEFDQINIEQRVADNKCSDIWLLGATSEKFKIRLCRKAKKVISPDITLNYKGPSILSLVKRGQKIFAILGDGSKVDLENVPFKISRFAVSRVDKKKFDLIKISVSSNGRMKIEETFLTKEIIIWIYWGIIVLWGILLFFKDLSFLKSRWKVLLLIFVAVVVMYFYGHFSPNFEKSFPASALRGTYKTIVSNYSEDFSLHSVHGHFICIEKDVCQFKELKTKVNWAKLSRSDIWPKPNSPELVILGGSPLFGSGVDTLEKTFFSKLYREFNKTDLSNSFSLINIAERGGTVDDLLASLEFTLKTLSPKYLIFSHRDLFDQSYNDIKKNYELILSIVNKSNTQVYWVLPFFNHEQKVGFKLHENEIYKKLCIAEELCNKLKVLDFNQHLQRNKFESDGLVWSDIDHLTAFGQNIFAKFLYSEMKNEIIQ